MEDEDHDDDVDDDDVCDDQEVRPDVLVLVLIGTCCSRQNNQLRCELHLMNLKSYKQYLNI